MQTAKTLISPGWSESSLDAQVILLILSCCGADGIFPIHVLWRQLLYSVMQVKSGLWQTFHIWAPSSEFVSSSIPSWQIVTAHAQPFRGARDLVFCLEVPLDSLLARDLVFYLEVPLDSLLAGKTARMHRLAWTFAAHIGDKYKIRLQWLILFSFLLISGVHFMKEETRLNEWWLR